MADPTTLPEFPGFTIYDAESGEPISDTLEFEDEIHYTDWLTTGRTAFLAVPYPEKVNIPYETLAIPKDGKHIIQMGDGRMYRW